MQSQDTSGAASVGRPAVFGEVLFDEFPDGSRVLGGAPFNVAWHLQAFGHQPLMITRIGRDESGAEIRDAMRAWGLDLDGVQTDDERPTGAVRVDLRDGQPEYTILPDQAYDAIDAGQAVSSARRTGADLLYHGTLAARSEPSLQAIFGLRREVGLSVFVDVNLRDPWWQRNSVDQLLRGATWLKLNEDELGELQPEPRDEARGDVGVRVEEFRSRYGAREVLLTRGELGAIVVTASATVERQPEPVKGMIDTVGAGDAFSAVSIVGRLREWPADVTLRRALGFASRICAIRGATTDDRSLYADAIDRWRHAET
jgi:fructokinase